MRRRVAIVVALAGLTLLTATSGAAAERYEVRLAECSSMDEPTPFALTPGPGLVAVGQCSEAAVYAGDDVRRVDFGASARATLTAPDGTTFARLEGSVGYERPTCGWSVLLMADQLALRGVVADQECERFAAIETFDDGMSGIRTLVVKAECRDPQGCPVPPPGPDPWMPFNAGVALLPEPRITLDDLVAPQVEVLGLGTAGQRWVRGVQPLRYDARDGSGIREASLTVGGRNERHLAACDYSRLSPCPQGRAELALDTSRLADGLHPITVTVADAGKNTGSGTALAYVDNTPPESVQPYVDGGSGWRSRNAFTVSWSAPPERYAPIAAAHYRVCRAGTGDCVRGSRDGTGIDRLTDLAVPGAGVWTVEVWREDEAGNADRFASPPVLLRLDNAPPALAFERRTSEDPRRVSAAVSDGLSGVAGGELQLRPATSGPWRPLPTRLEGGRLVAEVDDDRLPAGTYELRAVARDHAGNDGFTHVLPDGTAALLRLPLRAQARLTAGFVEERGRKRVRLRPRARAGFGAKVRISGRLANKLGRPVRGARLFLTAQARGGRERPAGPVTTNGAGEFSYPLRARASGTVRIRYGGSKQLGSARRELALKVPAASTLRVSHRRALTGQSVTFRGRLRGRPFPVPGKLINLQAYFPREGWKSFDKPIRTDRAGRWRLPYRFTGTTGVVHYRLRALVPREESYPFETGASNVVRVRVRGR